MGEEYVAIGDIVGTFGNKGAVKVKPLTDNSGRFEKLKNVFLISSEGEKIKEIEITQVNYRKDQIILGIKEYNNIPQAKSLVHCSIAVLEKNCPKLPKNSYYEFEIIGLNVYDIQDNYLGKVVDIYKTGSNDVYMLDSELLLPAIKEIIKEINLKDKKMIVYLMEGLI